MTLKKIVSFGSKVSTKVKGIVPKLISSGCEKEYVEIRVFKN